MDKSTITDLQGDFWNGKINECQFVELASEAGMPLDEIWRFLSEVRAEDGVNS